MLRAGISTYRVEWPEDDNEWVGLVDEHPSLSWLATTEAEALAGINTLMPKSPPTSFSKV